MSETKILKIIITLPIALLLLSLIEYPYWRSYKASGKTKLNYLKFFIKNNYDH